MIGIHKIGIIQGRLSKPVDAKIQAFPVQNWEQEFGLAAQIGLDTIEWIFEEPYEQNPLWTEAGRGRINKAIAESGVKVNQVCADYFMQRPFFRVDDAEIEKSKLILNDLIPFSKMIGASSIEIPLLDNSRVETDAEVGAITEIMQKALPVAEAAGITLSFETSLEPEKFAGFMRDLNHSSAKVVYDIGNSASLGYDSANEITLLGKYISNVHLKDRVKRGSTVPLGTGNADFTKTFASLKNVSYAGPITLQVARGEIGRESETTKSHLEFLGKYI